MLTMMHHVTGIEVDDFTLAYITAALWSTNDESTPSGGVPFDEHYTLDDLLPETVEIMKADCAAFLAEHGERIGDRLEQGGVDFWLTRNHHGAGFWVVPDWPEEDGKILTEAAHKFGEFDLFAVEGHRISHG